MTKALGKDKADVILQPYCTDHTLSEGKIQNGRNLPSGRSKLGQLNQPQLPQPQNLRLHLMQDRVPEARARNRRQ